MFTHFSWRLERVQLTLFKSRKHYLRANVCKVRRNSPIYYIHVDLIMSRFTVLNNNLSSNIVNG